MGFWCRFFGWARGVNGGYGEGGRYGKEFGGKAVGTRDFIFFLEDLERGDLALAFCVIRFPRSLFGSLYRARTPPLTRHFLGSLKGQLGTCEGNADYHVNEQEIRNRV